MVGTAKSAAEASRTRAPRIRQAPGARRGGAPEVAVVEALQLHLLQLALPHGLDAVLLPAPRRQAGVHHVLLHACRRCKAAR